MSKLDCSSVQHVVFTTFGLVFGLSASDPSVQNKVFFALEQQKVSAKLEQFFFFYDSAEA